MSFSLHHYIIKFYIPCFIEHRELLEFRDNLNREKILQKSKFSKGWLLCVKHSKKRQHKSCCTHYWRLPYIDRYTNNNYTMYHITGLPRKCLSGLFCCYKCNWLNVYLSCHFPLNIMCLTSQPANRIWSLALSSVKSICFSNGNDKITSSWKLGFA